MIDWWHWKRSLGTLALGVFLVLLGLFSVLFEPSGWQRLASFAVGAVGAALLGFYYTMGLNHLIWSLRGRLNGQELFQLRRLRGVGMFVWTWIAVGVSGAVVVWILRSTMDFLAYHVVVAAFAVLTLFGFFGALLVRIFEYKLYKGAVARGGELLPEASKRE